MAFYIKGKTGDEIYGEYVEWDVKFGPFDTRSKAREYEWRLEDETYINGCNVYFGLYIEEEKEQSNEEGQTRQKDDGKGKGDARAVNRACRALGVGGVK